MELATRFEFPRVGRVQVWTLASETPGVAMNTNYTALDAADEVIAP